MIGSTILIEMPIVWARCTYCTYILKCSGIDFYGVKFHGEKRILNTINEYTLSMSYKAKCFPKSSVSKGQGYNIQGIHPIWEFEKIYNK